MLLGTGALLKKIYFPSYAPVLGALIGVGIQSLIEVGLVLVVVSMFGNVGVTWLLLPFWAAIFMGFVAGVSMVLSIANIYFRDLAHLVSVFLQLLFYATPVLYQASAISNPTMRKILAEQPDEPVHRHVPRPGLRADTGRLEELAATSWRGPLSWSRSARCVHAATAATLGEQLMTEIAIEVADLSKHFRLATERRDSLKERFVRGSGRYEEFWALRDVSFEVERGTTFGLIGHNGSGKSTLLKILAGIYRPTVGNGRRERARSRRCSSSARASTAS